LILGFVEQRRLTVVLPAVSSKSEAEMAFALFFAMQISDSFPVRVKRKTTAANFEPSQNRMRSSSSETAINFRWPSSAIN
jgi:hypothetical protein